jgi:23S rRNA (pseudouridine1915-N3)-methyltransferase
MHVRIIWVGKTRNSSIQALISDYLERLRHLTSCEIIETRDFSKGKDPGGARRLAAEAVEIKRNLGAGRVVALDENGAQFTSGDFARWFEKELNQGTRELAFVLGGPLGMSPELGEHAHLRLSLGRMTWTHEMCRVLLLEQLYRAFSILRNIPYHK